jgi:hypothetical protein
MYQQVIHSIVALILLEDMLEKDFLTMYLNPG